MKKFNNVAFLKEVEMLKARKNFTCTDETGKTWTGEMAIAKHFGMSRSQYRAKVKEAKAEVAAATNKTPEKKVAKKPAQKKPPFTDVTIKGRVIPCEDPTTKGRYYVELPDGLKLVFDDDGYQGHFDPNLKEVI